MRSKNIFCSAVLFTALTTAGPLRGSSWKNVVRQVSPESFNIAEDITIIPMDPVPSEVFPTSDPTTTLELPILTTTSAFSQTSTPSAPSEPTMSGPLSPSAPEFTSSVASTSASIVTPVISESATQSAPTTTTVNSIPASTASSVSSSSAPEFSSTFASSSSSIITPLISEPATPSTSTATTQDSAPETTLSPALSESIRTSASTTQSSAITGAPSEPASDLSPPSASSTLQGEFSTSVNITTSPVTRSLDLGSSTISTSLSAPTITSESLLLTSASITPVVTTSTELDNSTSTINSTSTFITPTLSSTFVEPSQTITPSDAPVSTNITSTLPTAIKTATMPSFSIRPTTTSSQGAPTTSIDATSTRLTASASLPEITSTETSLIVPEVTAILSRLPFPTETIPVSPAQASANLEYAKNFNKFFSELDTNTKCKSGTTACIDGQLANCNTEGEFTLTTCGDQERCFAMPMTIAAGVRVACVNVKEAKETLGDVGKLPIPPTTTQEDKSTTSLATFTSEDLPTTTITVTPTLEPEPTEDLPTTTITVTPTLEPRPTEDFPTTTITITPTLDAKPTETKSKLTFPPFTGTPVIQLPTTEAAPISTTAREVSSTAPVPTKEPKKPGNGGNGNGVENGNGEVVTTLPLKTFTREPVITDLPPPPSESTESPLPLTPTAITTSLPVVTIVTRTQANTETPLVEPSATVEPSEVPGSSTRLPVITPVVPGPSPLPTAQPTVPLVQVPGPDIPDFDYSSALSLLPTAGSGSPTVATVTATVTKTERIKEKETVYITVTAA